MNEPQFRDLGESDVRSILARNSVGRLAFTWNGEVDIRPLHYVYQDGRIYGRTSPGEKFADPTPGAERVAFEVDEVESTFRWKSVIARGTFEIISPEGENAEEWREAISLMRRAVRDVFALNDPVPERRLIFRIAVDQATGRECA